ncbi:MAG: ComEC/Rec2 family competence protein [bacterium]
MRDLIIPGIMIFTFAFIGGVVLGVFYPLGPDYISSLWITTAIIAVVGIAGLYVQQSKQQFSKVFLYGFLIILAFFIGWGRYSLARGELYENHITSEGYLSDGFDDLRVFEGEVVEAPQVFEDKTRLRIRPERIWLSEDMSEPIEDVRGDILFQVSPHHTEEWAGISYNDLASNEIYGDRLRITGSLMEPMDVNNPGGFSYRQFLNNQGIYATTWYAQDLERLEEGERNRFVSWSLNLQTEMLKVIKMTMPYPHSAFLGGATLGLRYGLQYAVTPFEGSDDLINDQFRHAGTMHVLAVSGLHVGIIAVAFWALFAGLRIPAKIYAPMVILCLIIFTIITGARPATLRAAIMTSLMILAFAFLEQSLKNSVLLGITVAALLILLFQPTLVFEASFTLSFTAVLCLALMTGPADRILQKISGLSFILFWVCLVITVVLLIFYWNTMFTWYVYIPYGLFWFFVFRYAREVDSRQLIAGGVGFLDLPPALRNFLSAQIAIQFGMMIPLSAFYFLEYPFAGAFANFFAIPLVGVVVPLGLFAGLIGLVPAIGPWVALILNAGNYIVVHIFLWISHASALIFPYPSVRKFTIWHLLAFYGVIAVFIWWDSVYELLKKGYFWLIEKVLQRPILPPKQAVIVFLLLLGLIMYGAFFFHDPSPDQLTVTVMNVGYGEVVAIQTPNGSNILLNGGTFKWDHHSRDGLADRWDQGRKTVAPFFLEQGIKTLDLLVAQSPEPHRIGGLPFITDQFVVRQAVGPLRQDEFLTSDGQLTKRRYVSALHDNYLASNSSAEWFEKDYYWNWQRWWEAISYRNVPYRAARREDMLFNETIDGLKMKLIAMHPPQRTSYDMYSASNRSVVLRLEYGDVSVLFPGDIRSEAQEELATLPRSFIENDVMLVPASVTEDDSFNQSFLETVNPDYVIMSTGRVETVGGFAGGAMEERADENFEKYGSVFPSGRLFRTDEDLAIIIKTDGQDLDVRTFAEITGEQSIDEEDADVQQTGW